MIITSYPLFAIEVFICHFVLSAMVLNPIFLYPHPQNQLERFLIEMMEAKADIMLILCLSLDSMFKSVLKFIN